MSQSKATSRDTNMSETPSPEKFLRAKWLRLSAYHRMEVKARGSVLETQPAQMAA